MALTGAVAAAVVALAVLGARGDADTARVFAPSSLAPFEAELDAATPLGDNLPDGALLAIGLALSCSMSAIISLVMLIFMGPLPA